VNVTVAVIAKAPEPGRVKTRLCPPCTPDDAARIATAALADTIEVVRATECARRVVALDGTATPEIHGGLEVIHQRGDGLAERLAALFDDLGDPALVVAMDTPQVTVALLEAAITRLRAGADAVLGLALDGGYWAIGLQRAAPELFLGVPMHTPRTGAAQLDRLGAHHLRVSMLPSLRDVDTFDDALAVAAQVPNSRFAREVASVVRRHELDDEEAV
jgi:rSAM/selenodomain-associated transferase 1